jgi:peptide/nickel transport system ATP-binding protein
MTDNALSVRAVTKTYRVGRTLTSAGAQLHALRGVDLDVRKGETLGLVGESGCGKTTLARLILGVEPATTGTLVLGDQSVTELDRLERAKRVQPVFQDPYASLNPRMRVARIVAAPLEVRGIGSASSRQERVRAVMDAVGLDGHFMDAYPSQLSGGQRQRVAIARALIGEPSMLLCDEPTSALDVSVQSQILNLLARLKRELGLTLVLISHNLAVIHHLADRVAVMYLGRIVEQGTAEDVFGSPRHPYTAALLASVLSPRPGMRLPDIRLGVEFPSAIDPPSGCAFHPRCPRRDEVCATIDPAETVAGASRFRCHHPLNLQTSALRATSSPARSPP